MSLTHDWLSYNDSEIRGGKQNTQNAILFDFNMLTFYDCKKKNNNYLLQ